MAQDRAAANRTTPKCFISYSHDSEAHRVHVAEIAQRLRGLGVDTMFDQYIEHAPPLSWPQWMTEQIEGASHVLVIVTETYYNRFSGRATPGVGKGVRWEGAIITGELYDARETQVKFIPIIVKPEDAQFIPSPMRLTTRHQLQHLTDDELLPLVRQIRGVPLLVPAPLSTDLDLTPPPSPGTSPRSPASSVAGSKEEEQNAVTAAAAILWQTNADGNANTGPLENLIGGRDAAVSAQAAMQLGNYYYSHHLYSRAVTAYQRVVDYGPGYPVFEAAVNALQAVLFEMNSHLGDGGPVTAARQWIEAVKSGDVETSWKSITPDTRRVLAQAWIIANEAHPTLAGLDRESLASALSRPTSNHPLFRHFMATQLAEMQQSYEAFDSETWGAAERPRRFKDDYELVIFMDTGGDLLEWNSGVSNPALIVVLRRLHLQWMVAGFSADIPRPGWPPTSEPFPLEDGTKFIPNGP